MNSLNRVTRTVSLAVATYLLFAAVGLAQRSRRVEDERSILGIAKRTETTDSSAKPQLRRPISALVLKQLYQTIDVPQSLGTEVRGANDGGQAVGIYDDVGGQRHGFLRRLNGKFVTIDVPRAISSRTNGINNREDIAGAYTDATNATHAFVFSKGHYTTLDFPAAQSTTGMGINDVGDVAGFGQPCPGCQPHAFYWSAETGIVDLARGVVQTPPPAHIDPNRAFHPPHGQSVNGGASAPTCTASNVGTAQALLESGTLAPRPTAFNTTADRARAKPGRAASPSCANGNISSASPEPSQSASMRRPANKC